MLSWLDFRVNGGNIVNNFEEKYQIKEFMPNLSGIPEMWTNNGKVYSTANFNVINVTNRAANTAKRFVGC
jgi:hypothetical protein